MADASTSGLRLDARQDKGIEEFEDRSLGYEFVIRMKHKDWAKGIRISLASGKIVTE